MQVYPPFLQSQVSALAMGAKIWFRLNGVNVPWRPLGGISVSPALAATYQQGIERVFPVRALLV